MGYCVKFNQIYKKVFENNVNTIAGVKMFEKS